MSSVPSDPTAGVWLAAIHFGTARQRVVKTGAIKAVDKHVRLCRGLDETLLQAPSDTF